MYVNILQTQNKKLMTIFSEYTLTKIYDNPRGEERFTIGKDLDTGEILFSITEDNSDDVFKGFGVPNDKIKEIINFLQSQL